MFHETYADDGAIVIVALMDTQEQADLEEWVAEFGSTHLVGGDYDREVYETYRDGAGRPQYAVIDPGFEIVHVGRNQSEAEDLVVSLLEDLL